jgi:sugar/nucleoside kinase (ribokinase family)
MNRLAVIGNISRDTAVYPDGRQFEMLGGAALYIARAATGAGLPAAPVSVIGSDLGWITTDPRLSSADRSRVKVVPGRSCAFHFTYDAGGQVTALRADFGAARELTSHALSVIGGHASYHVCCRRPLDAAAVLAQLTAAGVCFSADFNIASIAELAPATARYLPRSAVVFVNAAEFAILSAVVDHTSLPAVVISDGPRDVTVLRAGRTTAIARPPHTTASEVTGAGDTLAGVFLAGMARNLSDSDALHAAVTAAARSTREPALALTRN